MTDEARARRREVRHLLRTERIGTQEELGERLGKRGFDVTQATLSRDLAALGAHRVTLPEGGSVYQLENGALGDEGLLGGLWQLVTGVSHNDSLVVVTTEAGAAPAVALALDRARLPEVLGTLAGDDTIFVAPKRKKSARELANQLQAVWRKGEE